MEKTSIRGQQGARWRFSLINSAQNIDEGILKIAFLTVKFDDGEAVFDHTAKDFGGFFVVRRRDADAAASFAGFDEFDFGVENGPVAYHFGAIGDLHVIKNAASGIGAHFEGFRVAMMHDAATVYKEEGVAHFS